MARAAVASVATLDGVQLDGLRPFVRMIRLASNLTD